MPSVQILPLLALTLSILIVPVLSDSATGRCGSGQGGLSCTSSGTLNRCCSQYGWCGDTAGHCGQGCQSAYGNCPPQPTAPPVAPRTKPGKVPYGLNIYSCTTPGTIAMTYDDGPFIYTNRLLNILDYYGVKATFFITGNNLGKGAIDDPSLPWAEIIRRMYRSNHQIAGHTWDHPDLNLLTDAERRYQMVRLETALVSLIGRYPTYMRPPYISCNAACLQVMSDLGYHVIIWDLNTDDYNNLTPTLILNSNNIVTAALSSANPRTKSFLSIAHDIHPQTVEVLTRHEILTARQRGFRFVPLGECLGDPVANWYRTP